MTDPIKIHPPLTDDVIESLKTGDRVVITGVIYTARDMAHKSMVEDHRKGVALPFDPKGQIIYYTGPTAPQGRRRAIAWTLTRPIFSNSGSRA
jgi:fumarate hydratase subunit beta